MASKHYPHIIATSLRGALHKAKGLACQDYYCHKYRKNKFVAVVADGAGSAPYSKIGAKIICETLCDILINSSLKDIRKNVINAINQARQKLIIHPRNKSKTSADLINFSATMVGVFCHHKKGVFFHIGDGAGIAYHHNKYDELIISEPENGAFSCETFFYTMDDWQSCLRFTAFENVDHIMLMTDGVTGFVFADDFYHVQRNFFIPVAEYLENETVISTAHSALINTLNDTRANRLNADDKTLLWVKL